MNIAKDDLKALVRAAVARHLEARPASGPSLAAPPVTSLVAAGPIVINASVDARADASDDSPAPGGGPPGAPGHPSQVIIQIIGVEVNEASCVIEPAVPCTHCGYCRSYGH